MKGAKKEAFLSALLTSSSIVEATQKVGISRVTAYEWMKEDEFSAEYERLKQALVNEASDFMQLNITKALRTVVEIMDDTKNKPQIRLNAALGYCNVYLRIIEMAEINKRLTALENPEDDSNYQN